jgi:hypothetical protein
MEPKKFLPVMLPRGWRKIEDREDGAAFEYRPTLGARKTVIMSAAVEQDGKVWIHASVARPDRIPSYEELVEVKNLFIGPGRKAVQIFAPMREHVNIHPNCLHLWACFDGDPLPDFTRGGKTI